MARAIHDGNPPSELVDLYIQVQYARADAHSLRLELAQYFLDMACLEIREHFNDADSKILSERSGTVQSSDDK